MQFLYLFLRLCNKLPQSEQLRTTAYMYYLSFCKSEFLALSSRFSASGFYQLTIKLLAGVSFPLGFI